MTIITNSNTEKDVSPENNFNPIEAPQVIDSAVVLSPAEETQTEQINSVKVASSVIQVIKSLANIRNPGN